MPANSICDPNIDISCSVSPTQLRSINEDFLIFFSGSSDEGETAAGGGADAIGGGSEKIEMEELNFSRSYSGNSNGNNNPIFRDLKPLHATSAHDLSQDYPPARSAHQHDFSPLALMAKSTYEKERTPSCQDQEEEKKSWDYSDKSFEAKDYVRPREAYQNEYRKKKIQLLVWPLSNIFC